MELKGKKIQVRSAEEKQQQQLVFMSLSEPIGTIRVQPSIDTYIINLLEHCLGDYVTEMRIPSLKLGHDQE